MEFFKEAFNDSITNFISVVKHISNKEFLAKFVWCWFFAFVLVFFGVIFAGTMYVIKTMNHPMMGLFLGFFGFAIDWFLFTVALNWGSKLGMNK